MKFLMASFPEWNTCRLLKTPAIGVYSRRSTARPPSSATPRPGRWGVQSASGASRSRHGN